MKGKKLHYYTYDIHIPTVSKVPELAVKNMMPIARQLADFDKFMPDEFLKENAKVDREFFWGIFYKLNPIMVTDLCDDIDTQRAQGAKKPEKKKSVKFKKSILGELFSG